MNLRVTFLADAGLETVAVPARTLQNSKQIFWRRVARGGTQMRKFSGLIAAFGVGAILGAVGYVQAYSGYHGHHKGSAAMSACMAAAPQSAKSNLWSSIKGSSLFADKKAVSTAKQNLDQAILAKTTPLTPLETALSAAQLKVLQDQDAIAQNVCGQLTAAQLAAANTLYTNLQNNRQTVRGYFEAAHAAAGGE